MKDKILKIAERVMLITFLIILIIFQNNHELWLDELDWSIGIVESESLKDVIKTVLATGENLPLFYIILFIIKSLFGYSSEWILTFLSATIFTIIGILGILKISDKLLGRKNRIYTIFFIFVSYSIMSQCGWQLRPYGLLFCCSAWMLYFYLEKLEDEKKSNYFKYTILMILLMYSHWFGVLISLVYALIDFILFLNKKINWKFIFSYIIAGLAFLPSFIVLLILHKNDISNYGVEVPNIINLIYIFRFLGGNLFLNAIILLVTIFAVFIKKEKNRDIKILSYVMILLIAITYIYSRFINPERFYNKK